MMNKKIKKEFDIPIQKNKKMINKKNKITILAKKVVGSVILKIKKAHDKNTFISF